MPTNDSNRLPASFTAFGGTRLLATGPIEAIVLPAQQWLAAKAGPLLILDDLSGQPIDLDLRGSEADALERLKEHPGFRRPGDGEVPRAGRGRPKLGVVPREVTLLPRHWDWLNEQPGGASVTLRKLVEGAMKRGQGADRARRAREAA